MVWIAFGAVVAVGCIVAAYIMRPEAGAVAVLADPQAVADAPPPPVAEPARPGTVAVADDARLEAPATAGAQVAPSAPSGPDAALAGVSVVRLRVGPGFDAGRQAAIVAALTKAGVPSVKVELLPFKIATSRVGYYRAADLRAAEELGKLISPVIAGGTEVGVRDYAQLLADPEPGRLDLWVGG